MPYKAELGDQPSVSTKVNEKIHKCRIAWKRLFFHLRVKRKHKCFLVVTFSSSWKRSSEKKSLALSSLPRWCCRFITAPSLSVWPLLCCLCSSHSQTQDHNDGPVSNHGFARSSKLMRVPRQWTVGWTLRLGSMCKLWFWINQTTPGKMTSIICL